MTCSDHKKKAQLIIFTRYPEPGTTKTRLIPAIGKRQAAQLQQRMTERIVAEAAKCRSRLQLPPAIHFSGGSERRMRKWLGPHLFIRQQGHDLGRKMQYGFEASFQSGAECAVLVGSDIPAVTHAILLEALGKVENNTVVIGPAADGGYYLLGFCAHDKDALYPLLFADMKWSTGELYARTTERLVRAGFAICSLEMLRDVDTTGDLDFARQQGLL
ncbi:TIGR04282 family arsenosugar biosynthesis glycosyltransferase [Desulforhopalus singaporensis]|uniref:Glycosyltransferase n=1 Tax=Desulforhopalus singaporensis TaxID=91360 RepID=A0A1H0SWF6_9BACT|nr:TIGR04282 family arsenosugar biosynthesis glycosyltransferase [Desulforhopalus singaporensis]SDP46073.1 hypothetical protein SAMN05660330_02831 [Desulforhopalus singaporensis]